MQTSSSGYGPDEPLSAEELQRWQQRLSPPQNEAPVAIPINAVLGRGPDAAILFMSAHVYSSGTEFTLNIRVRPRARRIPLHELIGGFHRRSDPESVDRRLLLGVEYSDGRRAATFVMHGPPILGQDDGPDSISLTLGSSSGSEDVYDLSLWLCPLPPPGPVTLVCLWPEFDITETKVTLDGATIAAAGSAAVELWPQASAEDQFPPDPPLPPLPNTGWFAGNQ